MEFNDTAQDWQTHGFVVLPGLIPIRELAPPVSELQHMFPSAEGFHGHSDARYTGTWMMSSRASTASRSAACRSASGRARPPGATRELLLQDDDIRIYSAEAWAKYTGAAQYDQALHRDNLNHTTLVPAAGPGYQELEIFLYLADVPEELGPPHLVSCTRTAEFPVRPNWYPQPAELTARVVSCPAPGVQACTERKYRPRARQARWSPSSRAPSTGVPPCPPLEAPGTPCISATVRPARSGLSARPVPIAVMTPAWYQFVGHASPRQLELFGFPPPGHPFWTAETLVEWRCDIPASICRPGQ